MTRLAVSFDPGPSHLGVAGISYRDNKPFLEFHKTFDIRCPPKGELGPYELLAAIDDVELHVGRMEEKYGLVGETLWVLEYQPPLSTRSNPGLVRQKNIR